MGQIFINDVIKNAAPNELFIIDDDPYTYVEWDNTDQCVVFKNMLDQFTYNDTNCINKAEFTDNDKGGVLKLSRLEPGVALTVRDDITDEKRKYLYYTTTKTQDQHEIQRDMSWSAIQ